MSEKTEKKEGKDAKKTEGKDEKNDNGSSGQTSESIKKSEEKKRISMLCAFLLSPFLRHLQLNFYSERGNLRIKSRKGFKLC